MTHPTPAPSFRWTSRHSTSPVLKGLADEVWDFERGCAVRKALPEDAYSLAPRLRPEDLREIRAVTTGCPGKAIEQGILQSPYTYSITIQNEVVAIFGVNHYSPTVGVIWLLGSNDLLKEKIAFLRQSPNWIKSFHDLYPILFNVVCLWNKLHVDWLKWLGFRFIREYKEYGLNKEPYIEFLSVKL